MHNCVPFAIMIGVAVYLIIAKKKKMWPFKSKEGFGNGAMPMNFPMYESNKDSNPNDYSRHGQVATFNQPRKTKEKMSAVSMDDDCENCISPPNQMAQYIQEQM